MAPVALYLHIPFCAVRCHYCDFNTYAGLEGLFDAVTRASARGGNPPAPAEPRRPSRRSRTVFIGGGTPTVLPAHLLAAVLEACRESFDIARDAEITSEANPGTVDADGFAALRELGVNRLSMGVQSFDDAELQWLGRMHSAGEAEAAYDSPRGRGLRQHQPRLHLWPAGPERVDLAAHARPRRRARARTPLALQPDGRARHAAVRRSAPRASRPPPDDDLAADLYLLPPTGSTRPATSSTRSPTGRGPAGNAGTTSSTGATSLTWASAPGAHSFDGQPPLVEREPVPQYIQRVRAGESAERGARRSTCAWRWAS